MIQISGASEVRNYLELGFNSQMERNLADRSDSPFKGSTYYGALEVDGMLEGVDIAKLLSNSLRTTMKIGRIVIDGAAGNIKFYDQSNRLTGILGEE